MNIIGKNAVLEAIESNVNIEKIYISNSINNVLKDELFKSLRENNIQYRIVDKKVLDKISLGKKHQGVIAVSAPFIYSSIDDIFNLAKDREEDEFILILDQIKDPHNLGSIIRTAECAGVHGIIIPKNRAALVNETVIKTSAGATSHVLIAKVTNINDTIKKIKKRRNFVYALEANGSSIYKSNLKGNISLVIGSEGDGVSNHTLKLCDGVLSMPLNGKINSLNAGVASGVAIYEAIRQRGYNEGK